MNEPSPKDRELIDYWSKAGTPHGRALIGASQWIKVLTWRLVVGSSLFIKRALDIIVAALTLLIWSSSARSGSGCGDGTLACGNFARW
jgi:hypothetical protein